MKKTVYIRTVLFILLLSAGHSTFAQDDAPDNDPPPSPTKSKFLTGFYVGSYFANKYSASAYNGYGFDVNGQRNTFENSFMHQKIINEYGGGYGQHDYIADALGVDQGRWEFNESDMPINMHYTPAILVGFNFKIPVQKKSAIIFNLNGTKLGIEGNFTITTLKPQNPNPALNNNIQTFAIRGGEQRLFTQLGYQHVFGQEEDGINFFLEAGFIGTLTKFDKNTIYINTLQIDLTYYVNQTLYASPGPTKRPVGFGIGAFAGTGMNIDINPKFTLQFLYQLSQEKINIGTNPKLKFQNGLGLRVYYNFRANRSAS